MKKRLLALLLCLVMVIGLVPTAFAADVNEGDFRIRFVANVDEEPNAEGYKGPIYWNVEPVYVGQATKAADLTGIPTPTKEGYTFLGWSLFDGEQEFIVKFDGTYTYKQVDNPPILTLYGIWEPDQTPDPDPVEKNTVTYKWDENSTTVKVCEVNAGEYHTVINYPTEWQLPDKKVFDHWTDGTKDWLPGQNYGAVDGNDVLHAVYKVAETALWTVTYNKAPDLANASFQIADWQNVVIDANGGTYVDSNDRTNNGKSWFYLPITKNTTIGTAKADGKIFIGWEKSWYQGDVVQLTARWKEDTATEYTVTFYCWYHQKENDKQPFARDTRIIIDPNYGTYNGSKAKTEITVTSDVTVKDASRYGYSFDGWYVTKDSAGVYTFTAVWDNNYYYNTYSIYYYDYDDCKSEYANFPYGTSVVIDPNGGTAKLSGTSFSTKQSFNIYRDYTLTDASRSGYTFYGWDLTKSGSTYYFTAMWSRYKSDVPYMLNGTDHYAYIKGYPNGSFKPTDTITRAEAATIFYRLLTDSTRKAYATTYNSFKDVPATAWYNTAVSTMAKLGIVNGGADGYFRPNDPITRAEIAAMIARCDGAYYTGTSTVFSDTYGHWAAGYIDRAYELGWINGYGTTYAPDRYISRAETVAVLNRVLNRAPQYTSDLTRNYTTFSDVATSAWYYLDVEEAANSHTYTRKSNADYETWTKLIADPSWF